MIFTYYLCSLHLLRSYNVLGYVLSDSHILLFQGAKCFTHMNFLIFTDTLKFACNYLYQTDEKLCLISGKVAI